MAPTRQHGRQELVKRSVRRGPGRRGAAAVAGVASVLVSVLAVSLAQGGSPDSTLTAASRVRLEAAGPGTTSVQVLRSGRTVKTKSVKKTTRTKVTVNRQTTVVAPSTLAPTETIVGPEGVQNPSAETDVTGWTAASSAGPVTVRRVTGLTAPLGNTTAIGLTRTGGSGSWALAQGKLISPTTFFTVGKTYRIRAYVRDLRASGLQVGLLLANNNYSHRPSDARVYGGYKDTDWHLLTRTFVADYTGWADTTFYVALPTSGALDWQLTAASVQEVTVSAPTVLPSETAPSRVLSFAGPAGSMPNANEWTAATGGHGWGNDELQAYTDRSTNLSLDGSGHATITVRRENFRGSDGILNAYTSAKISTRGKVSVPPGSYVEAPIKAPVGTAVWPAFWAGGDNYASVGWPACGEIDIMEVSGSSPNLARNAAHMSSVTNPSTQSGYGWGQPGGTIDLGESADANFHTYGVYFDANTIRFYLDRKLVRSLWASDAKLEGKTWPFAQSMHLVLNVAIQPDPNVASTTFPRVMTVGAVKIWHGGVPF